MKSKQTQIKSAIRQLVVNKREELLRNKQYKTASQISDLLVTKSQSYFFDSDHEILINILIDCGCSYEIKGLSIKFNLEK
jgi:hypothetical protein